jgi:diguanylate cyclase (GGDEF)-like protein/PAS domain S-box-containing protein
MTYQFPGFAIIFVVSAALCFFSAAILWQRRVNPGSIPFSFLMLALAIWSYASVFEAGATTVSAKVFWSQWQYIGITTIAPFWIQFTARYTRKEEKFSRSLQYAIWIIPVTTLLLAFTNDYHRLIWTTVSIIDENNFIAYYGHGVAFFVHLVYSYTCLMLGTVWLAIDGFRGQKPRRRQAVIFILSVAVVLGSNIAYNLRALPIAGFDLTPISISVIALVMAWTISRYHLFDLVPIARDTLMSSMQNGVIVIDPNDIVLEINPAALAITRYEGPSPVGHSVWHVFEKYQAQIEPLRDRNDFTDEVVLSDGDDRMIEVQVTSIESKEEDLAGQLIVLRDLTDQRKSEILEREQRAFVEVLADTAAVINRTLDLDEVLDRILDNVVKVVPHDSANIALMTQAGQARFVKVNNPDKYGKKDYLTGLDVNVLSIENFRKMADTGKPIIVADTRADKKWTNALEESKWIQSFLGAPIIHQGELLGFINLDSGKPHAFTQAHADRLVVFAEYAATAISNARNYTEIKIAADEMTTLYEISLAIAAGVGLEKTTETVFRQLKDIIPIDLFYLGLYEPATQIVSYYMYRGNGTRIETKPLNLLERPSMTRYVIEKREKVHIPDFKAPGAMLKENQIIPIAGFELRTALSIPLILRGDVIGVLAIESEKANAYSDRQIQLVETIAQQATDAMDNAKLYERLQELAITDGLTKIYNRRYFYLILQNEIERARRYGTPLSLVMMDIDHFKKVNDRFGHLIGDEVLESVAKLCKNLLRQADELFRYGGEEFMILLPETNADLAQNVAERIRLTVAETEFITKKGTVRISVSLGVAEFNPSLEGPGSFVDSADQALYEAKQAGRNCVRVFNN